MKQLGSPRSPIRPDSSASTTRDIDAYYGLEPLFEPGCLPTEALQEPAAFQSIQCPYCGECFDTLVDFSNGAASYIEDCQICCQPIEFETQLDHYGGFAGVTVHRC